MAAQHNDGEFARELEIAVRLAREAGSLALRYRDGDAWKNSTSFSLADLPAAITVMQMAMDHVASQEAATGT